MTTNHKLTSLIQGWTISGTSNQGDVLTLLFEDGLQRTGQTAGAASRPC